jgi:Fe-S-cluster-containing dehydrogenase component
MTMRLTYTELCMLCARRTKEGLDPVCVKHCMAAVIKYGRIENLVKEMDKPRMVLWAPRPQTNGWRMRGGSSPARRSAVIRAP